MGSVGDAYDNAMAESFFASLECELIDRRVWKTFAQARMEIFTWIEGWYNPRRRHSGLGQKSPVRFEREPAERPKHDDRAWRRRVTQRVLRTCGQAACGLDERPVGLSTGMPVG